MKQLISKIFSLFLMLLSSYHVLMGAYFGYWNVDYNRATFHTVTAILFIVVIMFSEKES